MVEDNPFIIDVSNSSEGPCDIDTHPNLRLAFISFGTVIALVGCACNLLLLFVFLTKNNRANPFQTFLAFLDFMLCFLFIACFGTLSFSVTLRVEWIYTTVKTYNAHMLIVSRIVQLCIPYILIANTAYRFAWITGRAKPDSRGHGSQAVVVIITSIIIILRLPGFFTIEIIDLPQCDFFASKTLSAKEMDPDLAEMYTMFDVIIQFFHLFVSFIILCLLNCVVVQKLRSSHKRARRQSSCPTVLHTTKNAAEMEERREHKQLRCAIKTTIVIISSYLACNSVNFVLYSIEMFNSSLTQDDNGNFNVFYVAASDLGTNLFVLSSTIRIFIFYKYNPEIRSQIQSVTALNCLFGKEKERNKSESLLTIPL